LVSASDTCTTNRLVPVVVGVPVIAPLDDSDNPAGNVPDARLHV
jgi:hypothetical protein